MTTLTRDFDLPLLLEVLVDPTRREVVEILGSGPCRAGELAERVGTSPSAMSRHLRVLLEAGVVDDQRRSDDARVRVFQLRPEAISPLQHWLDRLQRQWQQNLDSFKNHVETGEKSA